MTTTLWDFRLKQKIQELRVNQKTITDVKVVQGQDGLRVVTTSLDHQIKFIRPDIFQVTHQMKLDNPLISIDATQDGNSIIIGDTQGRISLLSRQKESDIQEEQKENDFIPDYLKGNPHLQKRIKNFKYYITLYTTPIDSSTGVSTKHQTMSTSLQRHRGNRKQATTINYSFNSSTRRLYSRYLPYLLIFPLRTGPTGPVEFSSRQHL